MQSFAKPAIFKDNTKNQHEKNVSKLCQKPSPNYESTLRHKTAQTRRGALDAFVLNTGEASIFGQHAIFDDFEICENASTKIFVC